MGVWKHGKIFGVEDAATKSYKKMENKPEMATPRKPSD